MKIGCDPNNKHFLLLDNDHYANFNRPKVERLVHNHSKL